MSNLKDYLERAKKQKNSSIPLLSSKVLANSILKGINNSLTQLSNDEAEEFSHKISDLATSDETINELSNEVGAPKDHETEDEFVERAKSALAKILKRKLSK